MILTNAVSGIARSGATRSGYPVLQGAVVPLYALSNVARSGATRSNYVGSQAFINIGGIDYGWGGVVDDGVGILAESLTKADAINNTPVTLQFTARGWVPVEGSDVVVTLGSKNNQRREFGGTILSTRHRYVGDKPVAANMLYDVACIDYSWALDNRKVSGNYTNASVAAVAASLLTFAPGYTLRVEPDIGAEILDQITFTEQALSSAFVQLAKRVGGDFLCDFAKVVHLFFENTALTPPTIVNAVHPSLASIAFTRDLSQVATRVLGNFGGSNALDQIAPGATLLPVETAAWYLPAGGVVLVGQQRVNYAGLVVGGGGALVGPGAAPTGVLNVSLLPGAGVDVGTHDYAVTYLTATGESLPGPRLTVPVGLFLPPPTAPTPGPPGPGATGPDPGVHDYAVSFVISTGETVPGPRVSVSTDVTPPPDTGPTPDSVSVGPGPDPGPHDYAVAFVTATGATPAGPIGAQITTGTIQAPISPPGAPTLTETAGTNFWAPGDRVQVGVTFITGAGETTVGPLGSVVIARPQGTNQIDVSNIPIGPAGTVARRLYRIQVNGTVPTGNTYWYQIGDNTTTTLPNLQVGTQYSSSGQVGPPTNTAGTTPVANQTVHLSSIPRGTGANAAAVTGRALYRRSGGQGLRWVTTIAGNNTTTYTDTTPNASLGGAPQSNNTATLRQIPLTAVPLGNSLVTARKVYRTPANTGGGTLKLVATIADNTTTTFLDTVNDAALGAAALTVSTAQAAQVQLSAIPLGPAAVTARKIYRTKAGLTPLQLLTTIADTTTTAWLDTAPDTALGALAPLGDTSNLQQPTGNVMVGSPTLPVASIGAFLSTGGWAIVGGLNLRYTGISGNALLGIPASGPGAITATITYNTTAVAAAMLTGIPATGLGVIKYPILKGDPVNIFVQVDDLAAQAAVRAQLAGSDGIIEDEIQDGRLSYTEGRARCQARLDLLAELDSEGKVGVISVSYVCRDSNTIAGATATINLGPPINLRGDFLIQRVGVAQFNIPNLHPTYTVEASSIRFSAEEMLRLLRQGAM
jgi:hypothetical protein